MLVVFARAFAHSFPGIPECPVTHLTIIAPGIATNVRNLLYQLYSNSWKMEISLEINSVSFSVHKWIVFLYCQDKLQHWWHILSYCARQLPFILLSHPLFQRRRFRIFAPVVYSRSRFLHTVRDIYNILR